jgi:phage tail sheath protein FI
MAPSTYATPGIYVEEISTLPPSVAETATAIPAFIGYTGNHPDSADAVVVSEIRSLRDFEDVCGRGPTTKWSVAITSKSAQDYTYEISPPAGTKSDSGNQPGFSEPKFLLWYAIDHYFRNGGGRCYVVSVGKAVDTETISAGKLSNGLEKLKSVDEPTLIAIPDAYKLQDTDFGTVCTAALEHAYKLQDRFVILDAKTGSTASAAPAATTPAAGAATAGATAPAASSNAPSFSTSITTLRGLLGSNYLDRGAIYYPALNTALTHLTSDLEIEVAIDGATSVKLESLKVSQTAHYNTIKKLLGDQRVILPPSAAVAGVYASVDRDRGVWKAPANVSLQAVVSPTLQLTDDQQSLLNIDATTGKSINAIRSFSGLGTLVWGARTLAGNSNEWRYISVRRLFISVEESIEKATAFAVFEPNDATTWLKVKGMIDSYLYTLWQRGALQGAKAEQAYFVNIGLNKTMTPADIDNGLLIVEIGLAAVRPAEFIVLRFSHKLAQ